ncbi:MAG: outer membrane protein assembly factor BamA [Pseudomonadota bacterium]
MKRAPFSWRRARQAFVVILVAGAAFLADLSTPSSASAQLLVAQASREQAVSVRGNRRIEAETILSYMDLRQGQTVTAEDLNRAVRRLFDTGLFRDVQIVPAEDQLIVEVIENPSINEIAFEGNDALADEDLERIISLRPRLPFTVSSAEADAQAIIEIYRRTGRFGAEVEPVIIERSDNRVDLVFEIAEGELTGVSSIDFVGNTVYSDRRLRGVVETSETGILSQFFSSDVYDPDRLELDKELLRQYYFERGYADFTVLSATAELAPDRDGFFITFTVSEGEEYTFGTQDVVVEAKGLDPEDFIAAVPDLEGETYDSSEVEDITNELTDIAGQAGFAFVQVRPRVRKNTEDRVIDLSYQVAEGPRVFIERIEIEGNTQTLDRVIRREIDLVEGDPFDARKIREARRNIRGLRYFSSVEVDTEPGATEDRATLKVKVREQSTGSLSFGVGFSTSAGPIGNVALSERNFLGRGQQLNLAVTAAGDTQVYDFSFVEPAFLDRDLSVGFRAFLVDDDRSDESSIEIARLGFGPTVGFPLGEKTDIGLRYEFVREDVEVDDTASAVLQGDEGVRFTSKVGYTLTYDERNDALETTEGYFLSASQDFAGLGGDARYVSTVASARGWTSFFDEELVTSIELEAAGIVGFGDDIRFNERFFLGGSNMRGFADEGAGPRDLVTNDSLGGNYRLRASLEASFPLGLPDELGIFGGAFVDAGTLFELDNTNGTGGVQIDDSANVRVAAGALLFLATPFGPLELSFGFPLVKEDDDDTEVFRLSVGTRF